MYIVEFNSIVIISMSLSPSKLLIMSFLLLKAWQLYNSAKKYIGNGNITLGAGTFKMALANSASNTSTFTLDLFGSLSGEISATGGYTSGGKFIAPPQGEWTTGASAKQIKFDYSNNIITKH